MYAYAVLVMKIVLTGQFTPGLPVNILTNICLHRDSEQAYKELEMQRGYCVVSTRYSPALIRDRALSSPSAFLQVLILMLCLVSLQRIMLSVWAM